MIKLPNVTGIVKVGKNFMMAYRPELLLGAAVTSAVGGAVLAAKGGYEARGIIDDAEADRIDQTVPLSVKEKIQLTWLCYVPAAVTVVTSVGSIGGLHLVHVKEKRALATAALAAIDEVKAEAKRFVDDETVGALTPDEKDAILESRAGEEEGIARVKNQNGDVEELYLVRDGKTGRDIWSNKSRIENAVLDVNNFIAKHGDCDLNSFYENAGFESIPEGEDWGWSGDWVELKWDELSRDDGRPVRRFTFRTAPKAEYDRNRA